MSTINISLAPSVVKSYPGAKDGRLSVFAYWLGSSVGVNLGVQESNYYVTHIASGVAIVKVPSLSLATKIAKKVDGLPFSVFLLMDKYGGYKIDWPNREAEYGPIADIIASERKAEAERKARKRNREMLKSAKYNKRRILNEVEQITVVNFSGHLSDEAVTMLRSMLNGSLIRLIEYSQLVESGDVEEQASEYAANLYMENDANLIIPPTNPALAAHLLRQTSAKNLAIVVMELVYGENGAYTYMPKQILW